MLGSARIVAFCAVTDAARAAAFYGGTLGLALRSDDEFALVYDANGVELRLQKVPALTPQPFTVLGWQVRSINDALDALTTAGVVPERYQWMTQDARGVWDAPGGTRVAWFKDPDGNLLSVAETPAGVP
jgi:catechol 2,3-dioxygenase-like lactoylglutathione lyase family enzyme